MNGYRINEQGRWHGRLTSRPLPENDDAIAALRDDQRALLTEVWLARAAMEERVGQSFVVIRDALRALGVEGDTLRLAERATDDELRHAEICRYVASRFHGSELAPPPRLPHAVPRLEGATPELRHTLHVVGQCALNETTASAVLEASLAGARGELAIAALRELLSDEIDHARIGWMHLAQVDATVRAKVARLMVPLTRANLKMWREAPRPETSAAGSTIDRDYVRHGALDPRDTEAALVGSVRNLIIPGFAALGMVTAPLEAWLAEGAPTVSAA